MLPEQGNQNNSLLWVEIEFTTVAFTVSVQRRHDGLITLLSLLFSYFTLLLIILRIECFDIIRFLLFTLLYAGKSVLSEVRK